MALKKILIIENPFRAGMGSFIVKGFDDCPDFDVETKLVSTDEAKETAKTFKPDVILVDMDSLRRTDALQTALDMRKGASKRVIIFMSERENPAFAKEGILAALHQNSYWLNKPCRDPKIVLREITRAYEGGAQLNQSLLEDALTESNYRGSLSPQQHRVMRLMASGLSNAAIGEQCGITAKAVERTISTASKILNVEPASALTNHRVNAAMKYLRAMNFI